jgi:AcrR family transcriptional regulator
MSPVSSPVMLGKAQTRRRSAEDTRLLLLKAASHLFARKGVAGLTLAEIACVVGLSGPAIYKHFSSKDALFIAVVQQMYDEEVLAFESVLSPLNSVADGLNALLKLVPKLYRDDGTLQLLGLTAQLESVRNPSVYHVLIDASRRRDQVAISLVERAKQAGELGAEVVASEVGAMLMSLFYGALGYRSLQASTPDQFQMSVQALHCLLTVMKR